MDKVKELTKSQKDEDKLLLANVLDKIKLMQARNRFENTDFLDLAQKAKVKEILEKRNVQFYNFFGGYEDAERSMLILLPEAFADFNEEELQNKIYSQIMSIIRITLPKEIWGSYIHKNYLGALMKLGLKREKIGDILVREDGADIVISKEIEKFLLTNLNMLTRFQKSKIEVVELQEIKIIKKEKELIKINIPSMRLDCIVGELARCSRNEANNIIASERVFINFKEEIRNSKEIKQEDIITIRGKGRFKVTRILGYTKSGRINIEIQKW